MLSDGTNLCLSSIEAADLTGEEGANTFTVSGQTGGGRLDRGRGADALVVVSNSLFTLSKFVLTLMAPGISSTLVIGTQKEFSRTFGEQARPIISALTQAPPRLPLCCR